MVQISIEKEDKATFNQKWSIDAIRVVGGWFHYKFRMGFWAHLLGFKMFNVGFTYETHNIIKQQKMLWMRFVGHVLTRLQLVVQQDKVKGEGICGGFNWLWWIKKEWKEKQRGEGGKHFGELMSS